MRKCIFIISFNICKNHILAWHLDPVLLIWIKFGMDILVDPRNKPMEEFFIFLKIQDGRLRSKVQNRPNLTLQITFRLGIWIRFIGFRQNLTLGTSLCKKFSFYSKSKMAARGQKLNFDIISAQKLHFGLANRFLSSDLDKSWQADTNQP
jgi:hypothetical protein